MSDDLTIAYLSGYHDGKKRGAAEQKLRDAELARNAPVKTARQDQRDACANAILGQCAETITVAQKRLDQGVVDETQTP